MSAPITAAPEWLPNLASLLERRPELANIGLAPLLREVTA